VKHSEGHLKGHTSHTSADMMMPNRADWPSIFQSYFPTLSTWFKETLFISKDGPVRYQLFIIVVGYKTYHKCILHSESDLTNKKKVVWVFAAFVYGGRRQFGILVLAVSLH
jgi:hypothetical protein